MTEPELPAAIVAARAADAKSGRDILVLEVGPVLAVCERFVIVSGTNTRQVATIAEEIEDQVRQQCGQKPLRVEGKGDAQWILLDYGDFVVHVFGEETRRYYDLERLWADVPKVAWEPDPGDGGQVAAGFEGPAARS